MTPSASRGKGHLAGPHSGAPPARREHAERLGVGVRLRSRASVAEVRVERPDAVVVAAGSRPVLPGVPLDRLPVCRLDPSNLVPLCKHVLEAGVTSTADHDRRGTTGRRARRQPEDALWHALRDTIEAHLVGEASAARPTDTVILEAAVLARRL